MAGDDEASRATRLESAKRASTLQLLFRVARRLNEHAIAEVRRTPGLERFRPAHANLFPHIDVQGTRLTEIAARAGISKQAVGQLVDDLVEMGALERAPDPDDGRAKRIRFAVRDGELSLMRGLGVLRELEGQLAGELGVEAIGALRHALLRLEAWLDAQEP